MKKFTSLCAVAAIAMTAATTAQAQLLIDWDDNGQYVIYPEDLVPVGGIVYDEDAACFIADEENPGKLMLNLDGKTIDFSEVAYIEVNGPEYKSNPWGSDDPLATLWIHDAVNGRVNEWFGSRYTCDYKNYAAVSSKVDEFWFTKRAITETTGEGEDAVTDTIGYVGGEIYIDEIVLTKSVEQDPMAITGAFWHEWDDYGANANILASDLPYCGVNLNTPLGSGSPFAGVLNGTVPGNVYADLTEYAGIYVKGTPDTPWRGLFNRQSMEDAGEYINVVYNLNEDGELFLIFDEDEQLHVAEYIHLNTVKINWGAPDGCKITKFNYIEKDASGIANITVNAEANSAIFNIYGQQVNENYKGLVIKNGKKYLVK